MAAIGKNIRSFLFQNPCTKWWLSSCRYSRYAPSFIEPVVEKEKLDEILAEKEKLEIDALSVKAAVNSLTYTVFYDEDIRKFTNHVMRKGKKEVARRLIERAFARIKHIQLRKYYEETNEEKRKDIILAPREIFHLALKNTTPALNVQKYKKSGSWYRVPVGINPNQAKFLAMRWIIQVVKSKPKKEHFEDHLAQELINASEYQGKAVQMKLDLHKLCEANRGYAHYRWT